MQDCGRAFCFSCGTAGFSRSKTFSPYIQTAKKIAEKTKGENAYDGLYRELTEEKAALEKKLASASGESIRKKLEINQKLRELEELRHTVEMLPPEILEAAKRPRPYKGQER